jgi:XRE family transcriptional regulator, master regulator for biofilm formation
MTDQISAGLKLKQIREEKGISLRELGKKADISHTYIYNIEKGVKRGNPEIYAKLATALGVSVADFFTEDKKEVPEELKREGVEWIVYGKELEKEGISMEMIRQIVENYKNDKK